jgi:predicted dehydrogenase
MNKKNYAKKRNYIMLFGVGPMAEAYAKVLSALGFEFSVFGRSKKSAIRFQSVTGHHVDIRPFELLLNSHDVPCKAIVAVSNDQLAPLAIRLINSGIKEILLEKPGGISIDEVEEIASAADKYKTRVVIGFNRRFYASTIKAKEIIKHDGGASSAVFQFTEWLHTIPSTYSKEVYRTWMLSNPIHVLDHFIHLCGRPVELSCFQSGKLDWHPSGAIFTGAGSTDSGALFSYQADWTSAGRWLVEIYTKNRKLIFCPMEKLSEVHKGKTLHLDVNLDDSLDCEFKPGLYRQVQAFLNGEFDSFCSIQQQLENFRYYYLIAGYENDCI